MKQPTEKCFYTSLIIILAIIAILLPIIFIQSSSSHYTYLSLKNKNETRQTNDKKDNDTEELGNFNTLTDLSERLEKFVAHRNHLYTTKKLAETESGNPIHEVILMKERQPQTKVLIVSGLLAKDWGSVLVSMQVMDKFFSDFQRTNSLLDKFNFHFIPLLNPDGYNHSMSLPIYGNQENNCGGCTNNGTYGNNIVHSFAGKGEGSQESKIFTKYFLKNKDKIKAAFFLFSPQNSTYRSRKHFHIPPEYMGKDTTKVSLIEHLALAIEEEVNGGFQYLKTLDERSDDRIDHWVLKATQPDPVLVVDFLANYRASAPEITEQITKNMANDVHFVITRLLGTLDAGGHL